ncbi:MAG TPA: PQQ-dependent dehydrogenase, methanol/ethanol family [Bryobacteraceae bacterium]|nr:PQQ-dependent dehydrogenase, methanol/ethanol family [Bryobacteraceae bacterium]
MMLRSVVVLLLVILGVHPVAFAQEDRAEAQRNPYTGNAQAIAAGRVLYNQACVACHGADGRGDRGPSIAGGNFTRGGADGEIFINIRSGIRGTQMPGFPHFTTEQTWQIVSYIRSLAGPVVTEAASSDSVRGDAVAGKLVFEGKGGCLACHQVQGAGTAVGPELSTAGRASLQQLQAKIVNPNQSPAGAPARGRGRGAGPATIVVKTRDGASYRGVRKAVDAFSIQMVDTTGKYRSFEKAALADFRIEAKSLMPDDYAKRLSTQEISNVVAYLKTLDGSDLTKVAAGTGLTWERIRDSEKEPHNYLSYWGDLSGKHYSTLNQINTANVKNLQAKWAVQLPGDGIVQAIPLVVDGIMYTTGPVGGTAEVLALDARTGRQIWRYQRKQKVTNPYEINRVNRGVTVFGNRLFFGTLDAALVALDARTGAFLWETQVADTMLGYSITSPPLVVKDKIISGITGGEFGVRGFLDAYDPATGKRLWRFYTVPGPGEFGNDTWAGDSWQRGGAPTWLPGSYDAESNTLYWATGNPGPDINGDVRLGDNLFSCSVIALDPDTGKRKWHYQFTPNDTHDWDSTEGMVLVDRMWRGQQRKLLLHADRNGVFYVLDRTNGKFLSATPFVRATWVKGWDANGRPILTDNSRATPEGVVIYPSIGGGTNFQAPSYSPQTGWMYFMYSDTPARYATGPAVFEPGRQYQGRGTGGGFGAPQVAGQDPPTQGVMAFDPEAGKIQWKFELTQGGLPPGVLATAGGVVFAASMEGNFIALDAKTGKALWRFGAGSSIPSSPMTYAVDGKQYVAVSSANVLYSFALPD